MDNRFEIIVTTLLGLEAFCAREIKRLGYEDVKTEDGRVTFWGDKEAIVRANMWIRTGERVLIKMGEFSATTYEELFEGTNKIEWERWLGSRAAFPVKGYTLKSKLASERDCQAIIKKAVAKRLSAVYGIEWFEETGPIYQIQFSLMKDKVTLMIDTSGEPLHKRGYRRVSNLAPVRETIAASIVMMSYWKYEYPLCDPFCGSGTIPIEAVMFKQNIAPGKKRDFAYEKFDDFDIALKERALDEAMSSERNLPLMICASDIDKECIKITEQNAFNAGVDSYIKPVQMDAVTFSSNESYGSIICNPPYGERLGDIEECRGLYKEMGRMYRRLPDWSCYILAADEAFEEHFGKRANKKRKIYNGMIKCNVYQYFGAKPPKIDK